jgi:hypothetical protein
MPTNKRKFNKTNEGRGDFGGDHEPDDLWNSLVRVIEDPNIDDSTKKQAKSHLSDLNTAGGSNIVGKEVRNFLVKLRISQKESIISRLSGLTRKLLGE